MNNALYWFAKILFGGYFVMSGMMHFMKMNNMVSYAKVKKLPSPQAGVSLSGLILIAGGAAIISGYYYAVGLLSLAVLITVISFMMHAFWKASDAQSKMVDMTHFMKNMALVGALLMMYVMI
jgi:putative oxidoreductase